VDIGHCLCKVDRHSFGARRIDCRPRLPAMDIADAVVEANVRASYRRQDGMQRELRDLEASLLTRLDHRLALQVVRKKTPAHHDVAGRRSFRGPSS